MTGVGRKRASGLSTKHQRCADCNLKPWFGPLGPQCANEEWLEKFTAPIEHGEVSHGAVAAGDLFRLVLDDPQFAWLRSLSALIARIDAAIDAEDALGSHDVDAAFREVYRLLKGGEGGDFRVKYHEALQRSPDVVMAHAAVSKLFLPSPR